MWTKPWTAVINWKRSRGELLEYACHEGNYSLRGMLSAARAAEEAAASDSPAMALTPGTRIGPYEVVGVARRRRHGRGVSRARYESRSPRWRSRCCRGLRSDRERLARFEREAKLAGR